MKQVVGIGMNSLITQPGETRTKQQGAALRTGMERGDMAEVTLSCKELLLTPFDLLVVNIPTGRNP